MRDLDPFIEYNPPITQMEEITLSWLQGRAPVGQEFELKQMPELLVDIYHRNKHFDASHRNIFMFLRGLERKGYISTSSQEGRSHRMCCVLRTLEKARTDR